MKTAFPALFVIVILLTLVASCYAFNQSVDFDKDPCLLLWRYMDIDGDNSLKPHEFVNYIETFMGDDLDDKSLVDHNRDGIISLKEYRDIIDPMLKSSQPKDPQQIHIALTGNKGEMLILWVTRIKTENSMVQFGYRNDSLMQSVQGSSYTYKVTPEDWVGWIHTATIKNIPGGVPTIYYRVGGDGVMSNVHQFNNPDIKEGLPVKLAVYGDMGTFPFGWKVTDRIIKDMDRIGFDAIVHAGDISYAGPGKDHENQYIWDIFGQQIEPIASRIPYMTGVGNHEAFEEFEAFVKRYPMPSKVSNGNSNFWWSFNIGIVHFTMISSEHDYDKGSPQYEWIKQDLEKANSERQIRPWIVVVSHRPMYATTKKRYDTSKPGAPFQEQLEPLLQKYKVDLMLTGHNHNYERTWPTVFGEPKMIQSNKFFNPDAPIWVVQGTAGPAPNSKWHKKKPKWNAVQLSENGYGRMNFLSKTILHYEYVDALEGTVLDEFWVVKSLKM